MNHLDSSRGRFQVLQERTNARDMQLHTIERRVRRWRGLVVGLGMLGLLAWALPVVAADNVQKSLERRVAALEKLLKHFQRNGNEVIIKGANLHIVNGMGATDTTNALGNLIVGYNEPSDHPEFPDIRTGSHNVVVGKAHNFSSFGGLVIGLQNEISGAFASVSGGVFNRASGENSSVTGGQSNTASGIRSSISGGAVNFALGDSCSVSGGNGNTAAGSAAWAAGGFGNLADSIAASVLGGTSNQATGGAAVVTGGRANLASGLDSSVSGGLERKAEGALDWVAGSLFEDE